MSESMLIYEIDCQTLKLINMYPSDLCFGVELHRYLIIITIIPDSNITVEKIDEAKI